MEEEGERILRKLRVGTEEGTEERVGRGGMWKQELKLRMFGRSWGSRAGVTGVLGRGLKSGPGTST